MHFLRQVDYQKQEHFGTVPEGVKGITVLMQWYEVHKRACSTRTQILKGNAITGRDVISCHGACSWQ